MNKKLAKLRLELLDGADPSSTDVIWRTFKDSYHEEAMLSVLLYDKDKAIINANISIVSGFEKDTFPAIGYEEDEYDMNVNTKENFTSFHKGIYKLTLDKYTYYLLFRDYYKVPYILSTEEAYSYLNNLIEDKLNAIYKLKTPNGVYIIERVKPGVYKYTPKKSNELPSIDIIGPSIDILMEDAEFFFNNIEYFRKYNKTPNRKILLAGPPGTGKSSLAYKVAAKYKDDLPVIFVNDIYQAEYHLRSFARTNTSSILILEDAESTLAVSEALGHEASKVLNFLDGINLPYNQGGFYMIMTTNYPSRIEDRIKKRPGRVDKIIPVMPLEDSYAIECANMYLKLFAPESTFIFSEESHLDIFNKLTGAQIKNIVFSTVAEIKRLNKPLDNSKYYTETFTRIKQTISENLKTLDDMEYLSKNLENKQKLVGF